MLLDRIALDFLNWVRSLFWAGPTTQKPHPPIPKIIKYETGANGLIQQVERNTKRAIATWIFTPSKRDTPSSKQTKYYLCLDLLSGDDPRSLYSHRVSVWEASAWIHIDGEIGQEGFEATQLYTGLYDLAGPGGRANWWGGRVLEDFAKNVLHRGIAYFTGELTWENEFRLSTAKVLNKHPSRPLL